MKDEEFNLEEIESSLTLDGYRSLKGDCDPLTGDTTRTGVKRQIGNLGECQETSLEYDVKKRYTGTWTVSTYVLMWVFVCDDPRTSWTFQLVVKGREFFHWNHSQISRTFPLGVRSLTDW